MLKKVPNTDLYYEQIEKNIKWFDGTEIHSAKLPNNPKYIYDVNSKEDCYILIEYKKQVGLGEEWINNVEFHLFNENKE